MSQRLIVASLGSALILGAVSGAPIIDENSTAVFKGSFPIGTAARLTANPLAGYSNVDTFTGSGITNGGATAGITTLLGDDIAAAPANVGLKVTQITWSVANFNTTAVSARARVRYYLNNGAGGGPGTLIGGSSFNPISFGASSVNTFSYTPGAGAFNASAANDPLPANFWAAMTFDNVGTTTTNAQLNNLGQGTYNPPAVGSSADTAFGTTAPGSFFADSPAGSQFNFSGSPVANLGWEFVTVAVPEPASFAVLGLGGLALVRRRPR